ncbi:hypothetical protein QBC47DRAFT_418690 [Echria macrotheca]|uniref:Uncharacterized protein n=1 Tax=Echria macrotheca TaxID=438768 RepID=A0AAJ0B177_9PEZI|nr:hypothetical protein QBC47DRAFT_418690 [Echria macrotheca]
MAANPAAIPSSQHHSGLPRQLSSITDLSAEQQTMCDDIIKLVAQAGRTGEVPSAESRAGFWALVFADGWNTNSTNRHPGEIPDRRAVHSRIHIGTWDVDLPVPMTPSKKRKNAAPTIEAPPRNPKAARRAGAPAYLKPNLNWSRYGLTFIVCDENGSAASDQFLRLADGLTIAQAHSDVIKHFDKHESRRVTEYNNELGACWGRSRLLTHVRTYGFANNQGGLEVSQGGRRPTMNAGEIPIIPGQLVKLETCYGRIQNLIMLVHDSAAIATVSRGVRYADHREK